MGARVGRETDALVLFAALSEAPYRHDFYQTLRRIECVFADNPRWGHARKPAEEPVRLGQEADLAFAPSALASFTDARNNELPRLQVHLFGLLGPNGPLPLHITEYARERLRHAGDPTLSRFLDILNHRFLAFFYRAWAQAQPHVNRDRPDQDRFAAYTGAFLGVSQPAFRDRDEVPDLAKLFHAGTLIRQARHAEGLAALLEDFFQIPVRIQEFVGPWMDLGPRERTHLGREGATVGFGAVLGGSVWDRQHNFRIRIGSLSLAQYEAFLPGGASITQLVDWVRLYLSLELAWDARLVLRENEVPLLALGRTGRLGWTTWLGRRPAGADADDLCLVAEAFVNRAGVRAA
jgi:type VI secretion system protein ImpH